MSWLRNIGAIAIALTAVVAVACGDSDPPPPADKPGPGDQTVDLEFDGKARAYTVHAPPGYDGKTALPVVVVMHYRPGTSAEIAQTSGMNAKADQENFLVVYPQGLNEAYNALVCCGSEDDVGFIKQVVARMTEQWKADPKRVYATGISNGADMSYKLAVEVPGTFAAIAPVSGGFIGDKALKDAAYKPATPVSVITFLGGKDRAAAQLGLGIETWQQRQGCAAEPVPQALPRGITLTAGKCADGSDVQVYKMPEMNHSWPGGQRGGLVDPAAGVSATDLMWEFFKTHTR
ncbi:PHB depolymerase family esterase [Nocardia sp. XZ_19_385]|uniref:extracellular catalytic domain type 1 short-chain-length polyhydroxyalkanoate depolymerase n=1 Tax=Nocardia sp. XZ_19_385 TaxID=2769488 RepID=UPI00188E02A9|nr:PHB depolymerase family esterase [Nocardia sp. XZ_19_385]